MGRILKAVVAAAILVAAPVAAAAADKDTLTVAFAAEPTTLDPVKFSAGVDLYGIGQIFEQLLRPGPDGKIENWLAESWKIEGTAEQPIIDVHIRPGVKFQNGDPLTSSDFEFSYQRLRDPSQSRWSHLQASVESFEIVDDLHFRLHFKQPDANYLADMLEVWALPKAYIQKVGVDGFARAPVGTGPWRFVDWKVKEQLDLTRFDGYWNKDHRPSIKNLAIKFIPEDLTRVAAYKTGDVDWIDAVPPAMLADVKAIPDTTVATVVDGNNLFLNFPTQLPNNPFDDVRVRQAAAYAIDMDAVIKGVLFGLGERYAEVGKGENGFDPSLQPYPYDPKKASELLKAAGFPNGFDTPCYNLTTPREPNIKEVGEAMFAYLSAAGIRCHVVEMEYGAWINLGRRERPQRPVMDGVLSWMWAHGIPGDPATPWTGHLHSFEPGKGWGSYSYTSDPEVDALVEQMKATMDTQKRDELIAKIARIKHDKVLGGLTTYRPLVALAWRSSKVDFTPWPGGRQFQEIGLKP